MKKISALTLVTGLALAACSSHGNTSLTPAGPGSSQMSSHRSAQSVSTSGASAFGMQSMAAQALVAPADGWASTARLAIAPANGTDLGALSPSQPITVRVGLQLRNTDQLKQGIAAGQEIDPGTFNAAYAPTTTQVNAVTAYLSSQGFSNISVEPNNLETGALLWGGQAANGSCTPCVTGGTSLASPLSAGVWARLQTAHGNRLGFAPLRLYHNFTSHAAGAVQTGPPAWQPDGGFRDILNGANGLYQALPGYDYTTGLGSFDVSLMNQQI
jgi:pro-kumamolisin-like protein